MSATWTNEELQDAIQELMSRTATDLEFRALALKDSASAIEKIGGRPLVSDMTFKFVDNSGTLKTIPLPDLLPALQEEELSEAELEAVAGGASAQTVSVATGWSSLAAN